MTREIEFAASSMLRSSSASIRNEVAGACDHVVAHLADDKLVIDQLTDALAKRIEEKRGE
jgi:hypothetical protein